MRVLVALDKFKDALSAPAACAAVADTLHALHPDWAVDVCPLADGGEGFASILTAAAGGTWHCVEVTGPRGDDTVHAGFGLVSTRRIPPAARVLLAVPDGLVGVIEMAAASGLALLDPAQRDPWRTTSRGTGELLAAATAAGATSLLLGIGGSATNDLGVGALTAWGWRACTATGEPIHDVAPAGWRSIARFEIDELPHPPLRIACDVANPLLGPGGATHVFGPQKGLRPEDAAALEEAATQMAHRLARATGVDVSIAGLPGAGAAGGLAYGLMVGAGATLLPGFDLVAAWLDLDRRIAAADLVITGEGRFDATSLGGKGPGAIVARARACQKRVLVLAGAVDAAVAAPGEEFIAITPAGEPLAQALPRTASYLAAAVRRCLA